VRGDAAQPVRVALIDRSINFVAMAPPASHATEPLAHKRPGRPTRDDGEAVRERLLAAATELTIDRGFDAAGIREIADRAGVSSGMIAYYFGSRRGLYEAMFARAIDSLSATLASELGALPPGGDPIETLIRTHATAIAAEPWILQLLAREVLAREGNLREHFKKHVGPEPLGLVRRAITDAISRGALRGDLDPTLTLFTLLSLTAFPYLIGSVLGDQLDIELDDTFRERLVEHNLALIARGLRAREEGLT